MRNPLVLTVFNKLIYAWNAISIWKTQTAAASFEKAESAAVGAEAIHVTLPGMVYKQLSSPLSRAAPHGTAARVCLYPRFAVRRIEHPEFRSTLYLEDSSDH